MNSAEFDPFKASNSEGLSEGGGLLFDYFQAFSEGGMAACGERERKRESRTILKGFWAKRKL